MAESMMLPHESSAVRTNERAQPYHSDANDGLEDSTVPHSEPIGSSEHIGLTSSEKPIGRNDSRAPLGESSSEQPRNYSEADKLWLKTETGYSSYADYLEAYIATHKGLNVLVYRLTERDEEAPSFSTLDLCEDENARLRVVSRFHDNIDSATRVVTSLRQPPADVTVQIVLWNSKYSLHKGTVNAFGPAFKLNPRFWGALYNKSRPQFDPRHIRIGRFIATLVRHYKPDELDAVPVVLIACHGCEVALERAIDMEICDVYPLQDLVIDRDPSFSGDGVLSLPPVVTHSERHGHTNYQRILQMCLDTEKEHANDVTKLILRSLIPLIYLSVLHIRIRCDNIRSKYRLSRWKTTKADSDVNTLPDERIRLRISVEESEDDLSYLRRYISSQMSVEILSDISWRKAETDLIQTHQEAGRLESQIRDYMQLQVGEFALQESKKSIELSNQQIEEGRRVKIFTVLAFVYIPLNLATSIFGMNLSELNGSGKSIWVFLCTATIALLTTGALWFVLEEVNTYLRWRRGFHDVQKRFALGQRICMLVWLQQYGHTGWMWESGAWWRLLINSGSRVWEPGEVEGLRACDIVLKYGLHDYFTGFDPFDRRYKYEWRRRDMGY